MFLLKSDVFDEKRTTPPKGAPQKKTVKAPHIAMRGKRLPLYIDVTQKVQVLLTIHALPTYKRNIYIKFLHG